MREPLRDTLAAARGRLLGKPEPSAGAAPAAPEPPPPAPLLCWPIDHFYSPVPDHRRLATEPARSRLWPLAPPELPGIDWREGEQLRLAEKLAAFEPLSLPGVATGDPTEYFADNGMFSALDATVLAAMLQHLRPEQMVEVGCGFSTLLTARVIRERLGGAPRLTCIEPHPADVLREGVKEIAELIAEPVEEAGLEPFGRLRSGDVLFIDTSHVSKTGGDVDFLFGQVLPRLAAGVTVHVHDVWLPFEYPEAWVFEGRAWNEQYLVKAFLAFNSAWEVLLSVPWLNETNRPALEGLLENPLQPASWAGSSLWIRRRA